MSSLASMKRGNQGQNAVEFALALPVFLATLFGLVWFAFVFYSQVTLSNAARVGANCLVRFPTGHDDYCTEQVRQSLGILDQSRVTIQFTPPEEQRVPKAQVDVSLRYQVPFPTLAIPNLNGEVIVLLGPLWLRANSTMNLE